MSIPAVPCVQHLICMHQCTVAQMMDTYGQLKTPRAISHIMAASDE